MITEYFETEAMAAQPRTYMRGSEWAEKYRVLTSVTSSITGKWQNQVFPHASGILDTLVHENVSEVSWVSGTQNAKTETILNAIGFLIHNKPASMMLVMPEKDDCRSISKVRLQDMIENAADGILRTRCELPDVRKDIFNIPFVGGMLYLAWATSVNRLASRPVKYLFLDEIDKYKDIPRHGNPESLVTERLKAQINTKILRASSPTIEEGAIWTAVHSADYIFERYVICPACNSRFVFMFSQIRSGEDGVYYECPHCSSQLYDNDKPKMLNSGVWLTADGLELQPVIEEGSDLHIGFKSSSFYSPFISFTDIYNKYQDSEGDIEKKRVFNNGWLALPYDPLQEIEQHSIDDLKKRVEDYDILPAGVCVLTSATDVQHNRLETLVMGWGLNRESWVIEKKIFYGDPRGGEVWRDLDIFLYYTRYRHFCGRDFGITCSVIDAGYLTEEVSSFTKPRKKRHVYAIQGASNPDAPMLKEGKTSSKKAILFTLGTHILKETITTWISSEPGEPGYMHFKKDTCNEEYFLQLTAEKCISQKNKTGKMVKQWVKLRDRNEVFDLTCYNLAAYHIIGAPAETYAKQIEKISGMPVSDAEQHEEQKQEPKKIKPKILIKR